MGPIPQPTSSQYRPPQQDTNPNIRKGKAIKERKRTVPTKRFRPNTASRPSETAMCPPVTNSKAPINVKTQADASENRPLPLEDVPAHESTPWPGAVKMTGNLFEERKDWLLPPNHLNNGNKDTASVASPKPPIKKTLRQENNQSSAQEQRNVDGDQIVPSAKIRKKIGMATTRNNYNRKHHLSKKSRCPKQGTLRL